MRAISAKLKPVKLRFSRLLVPFAAMTPLTVECPFRLAVLLLLQPNWMEKVPVPDPVEIAPKLLMVRLPVLEMIPGPASAEAPFPPWTKPRLSTVRLAAGACGRGARCRSVRRMRSARPIRRGAGCDEGRTDGAGLSSDAQPHEWPESRAERDGAPFDYLTSALKERRGSPQCVALEESKAVISVA
jgi:hypothetical protein